jgi:hypothetical protein
MWFSQAEAQFCRAWITVESTMYNYVLMKLLEDVVMSVRALISEIQADPVKQESSYQLLKDALIGSYGKTKWQMAYALLDHPDLGDRRPSAMMAEMPLPPIVLRRLPSSIRDHIAAANHTTANHTTATEMAAHANILWDARSTAVFSAVSDSLAAISLSSASPWAGHSPDRRARSPDRRARSPDPHRDNVRQPPRRPTPGRKDSRASRKLCFYHSHFGVKATKCQGSCDWTEN